MKKILLTLQKYHLKVIVEENTFQVFINEKSQNPQLIIKTVDNSFLGAGYLGLNVWQSSVFFQNVVVESLNV